MNKTTASLLLGTIAFLTLLFSIVSLFFAIPGLILAISELKKPSKNVNIPLGIKSKSGSKETTSQLYMSNKILPYFALGLNGLSFIVALPSVIYPWFL